MYDTADRLISRVAGRFATLRLPTPSVSLLGEARSAAAAHVHGRFVDEARVLCALMDAGDRGASTKFGELAARALVEMRLEVADRASRMGLTERALAALHTRFADTDATEYIDDPALDRKVRVRLLERLDALNVVIGSYRAFFRAMEPLLLRDRPTRVLDLASGHGGFALEAVRIARRRGLELDVTATDIKPEYLDIGAEIAEREGVDVRFSIQDALDLSNIERGAYDVIVCTQSLHHFGASMTARMFREAARSAGTGVVFVDGCRSVLHGMLVPALSAVRYADTALAHDGFVSFRRFYAPEELGLIAGLGPEGDTVESEWMRPAHCLLRMRTSG